GRGAAAPRPGGLRVRPLGARHHAARSSRRGGGRRSLAGGLDAAARGGGDRVAAHAGPVPRRPTRGRGGPRARQLPRRAHGGCAARARGRAGGPVPRVCVVGSANVDFTVALERLPSPGETVSGGTLLRNLGGKEANQGGTGRRLGAGGGRRGRGGARGGRGA